MHRSLSVAVLFTLLLPSFLRADDFSAFRIPAHQVHTLSGTATGSIYSNLIQSQNYAWSGTTRHLEGKGGLEGEGFWLWDSDPRLFQIYGAASAAGQLMTENREQRQLSSTSQARYRERLLAQGSTLSALARFYPFVVPLGLELNLQANALYGQNWSHQYSYCGGLHSRHDYLDAEQWIYRYSLDGGGTIGWGRVRDATAVYDVHVLETRLAEAGLLARPLTPAGRQKLVSLLYLEADYGEVHEQPERFFWREVETILRTDGALGDHPLDAYALYRIAEPLLIAYGAQADPEQPNYSTYGSVVSRNYSVYYQVFRRRGWFVGMAVDGSHHDLLRRDWERRRDVFDEPDPPGFVDSVEEASSTIRSFSDLFQLGPQLEYHRPFGWRWQMDLNVQVLFPLHNLHDAVQSENSVRLYYLLADRWIATGRFLYSRDLSEWPSSGLENTWRTLAEASLYYTIEDHIGLSLTAYQQQNTDVRAQNSYPSPTFRSRQYYRTYYLTAGLTYHFAGRLTAPGIVAPTSIFND